MKYRFDQIAINSTTKKKPVDADKEHYIGLEHIDSECLTITRWGSDVAPTGEKLIMCKGDVLFGKRRAYQRKVGIAPFDGIFSAHGMVLRPKKDVIDERFFPFFISSDQFMERAVRISVGGLSPTINWKDLKEQEFELPPLSEQRVIADKLWAAYRLKESYKKLLKATDEMVKSQFIEMFGNPLSDVQKYDIKPLGECCIINPRRANINLGDNDEVSFVPMQSVSEDGNLQDVKAEAFSKVKKGFTYFENNDVLFAKITPCMENGKGAIAQDLSNGIGMGSTEFHVLRPVQGKSNPYWLLALTRMPIFRERASKNMSGTGGQKRVPTTFLEKFKIGLPPIEEQEKFEAIYKQSDKSKFVGFKSQFIEMFGDPIENTKNWDTLPLKDVAPETPSTTKMSGRVWLLNLDMVESNTGKIISKVYVENNDLLSVAPFDEGNVLYSKLRPYLNKVVVPNDKGYATTELLPLRPDKAKLNKVFFSYLLRSNQFVNYANSIATGTKMPRVPLADFRKFRCILPPMPLQQQFVSIAEQADKSKYFKQIA